MFRDQKIGIIVPAYNEQVLILETLSAMPEYVDRIFVVNDGSNDNTLKLITKQGQRDPRLIIINHTSNKGLGQSLIDGYLTSQESDIDITAVMAGDNQMHPDDLPRLLEAIIDEGVDYVKGNRLLHKNVKTMPRYRFFGNAILTILTKFATGYYSLMDPQCGYTAIRNTVLGNIPIESMTRGFGYNADILCMLNIQGFKVKDVEVRPVYGREISKIKLSQYIISTSWLLVKLFFRRLWQRYVVLDFHPLVLFYLYVALTTVFALIPLTIRFIYLYITIKEAPQTTLILLVFVVITTFQSVLFALWMDMDYNRSNRM